jgi:hypothetical protein
VARCSIYGAGGESHGSRKKPKVWFLTFGQKLKVISGGFVVANPMDSRVAKAEKERPDYRGFTNIGNPVFNFK